MKKRVFGVFLGVALLAHFSSGYAAVDYYLEIKGIEGESTSVAHPKTIECSSFSLGLSTPAPALGVPERARPSFSDFTVTKDLDKSSPLLYLNSAKGTKYATVTFYATVSGESKPQDFYKITLSNVLITSVQTSGSAGAIATETLSLNFTKIEFEYRQQKPDGTLDAAVKSSWDLENNTGQ